MAPPFKKAEIDIIFSEGISRESSIIDLGVEKEIIMKSGSFFSYEDQRLGQGRESARKYLKEEKSLTEEIDQKIRNLLIEN
jgi:recombination protein RecA